MSETRTVREMIDAPKRMTALQKVFWDAMYSARLSKSECVALLEGMKHEVMKDR